jgi:outer membrane lipase/esterase
MRLSHLSAALALALTASTAAQAQVFSEVVSFGDSLTDAGNVGTLNGLPPDSSFTTNQDPVYAQILSLMFGLGPQTNYSPLIPGSSGSNYAYGGACAIKNGSPIALALPGLPTFTCSNSPGTFSLPAQMIYAGLLTPAGAPIAGSADPNALYTYWAGANDILSATSVIAPGGFLPNGSILYQYLFVNGGNPANATAIAQTVAGQAGATAIGEIKLLQAAGAKTIVVFNLPDLGLTPLNIGTSNQTGATALSIVYNSQFNAGLATLNDGIVAINTFAIINEIKANPAAYGFTNTTGKACPASSLICGPASAGYPTQPTSATYLFADDIHPSGRAHAVLANVVYATIKAPGIVSLAPEVALQANFANNTALEDAINNESAAGAEVGKVIGYASVQFTDVSTDATPYSPELSGDMTGLNIGASYRVNDNVSFALGATLGDPSGTASNLGEFSGNAIVFGGVLHLETGGIYGRAALGIGTTDMDITRNIDQLSSIRRETGNTSVDQTSAIFEAGYQFKYESFRHGPYIGIDLNYTTTSAFVENGSSSTAMRFEEFESDTNDAYFGYRFSGQFGSFRPFIDVAYVNPNNDDQTFVTGGTASLPGSFTFGGYTPGTDEFIDYNIGAAMTFAEVWDGYLSFRGQSSDGVQDGYAISLGVRRTF